MRDRFADHICRKEHLTYLCVWAGAKAEETVKKNDGGNNPVAAAETAGFAIAFDSIALEWTCGITVTVAGWSNWKSSFVSEGIFTCFPLIAP